VGEASTDPVCVVDQCGPVVSDAASGVDGGVVLTRADVGAASTGGAVGAGATLGIGAGAATGGADGGITSGAGPPATAVTAAGALISTGENSPDN